MSPKEIHLDRTAKCSTVFGPSYVDLLLIGRIGRA